MVIGGAEVSTADAATITPTSQNTTFSITVGPLVIPPPPQTGTVSPSPSFQQFDPSLGNLTSVDFSLDSNINTGSFTTLSFNAAITVDNGVPLNSQSTSGNYDMNFTGLVGAAGANNGAFYKGTGFFSVVLTLTNNSGPPVTWDGQSSGETGLTLTYDYTPTSAVPLPAALPLFATGLAGIGLTAWRSRRKQKPATES
jgi:hypothetical protein